MKNNNKCNFLGKLDPCTIVIFGASGDLTARKLMPALYNLFLNNSLPRPVSIVGCSRTGMSRESFADRVKGGLAEKDLSRWDEFCSHLFYQPISYDHLDTFHHLAAFLENIDRQRGTAGNRIYYLAIPPTLYPTVSDMIGLSGMAKEREEGNGWCRIVVEKPFGRDLQTAISLETTLHKSFTESQIFRIDHYLAKETVQNILMFRFANTIFEPLWNRNYIESVGIIAAEKLGVEHRAGYYEESGVVRDMFQNHLMQLLALTAMESPSQFIASRVQDEKIKVFRALRPLTAESIAANLVLGQYGPGTVDDCQVNGYRQEPGVAPSSPTPTFAILRTFIDNWRWQGVPFYLASGKRLATKVTRVVICFKKAPHSMFRNVLEGDIIANRLTLAIFPEEEITLTFQTKKPGARACLRRVTMDFKYSEDYQGPPLAAYEKVLLDCIRGDHMLFWRQDGVERSWAFLTPILELCDECGDAAGRRHTYASGSWGPPQAARWMGPLIEDIG